MIKKVLTIAGSDSSGGAGIQADIKTITAHKMYAMSAITALTAQNTMGVAEIFDVSPEFVSRQLDCIFTDIFPDAVKIGMVSSPEIINVISERLRYYNAKNIVLDPVMVSTSGCPLISEKAMSALRNDLIPLADIITPNIPESEVLCGFEIKNEKDMIRAAQKISEFCNSSILIKGGHLVNDATDLLYESGKEKWFRSPKIDNPNTHGTGCTLSSAIACGLADGLDMDKSIENAKKYLTGALSAMLDLGKGAGPLEHTYRINNL